MKRAQNTPLPQYDHLALEPKWQKKWAKDKTYVTKESADKEKCYVLDMFPYPSGEGLHVGHPKGYIATDVVSRMKRMQGKSVLHPMGFDAFGLPAENYAIKMKTNPAVSVAQNVARYKKQLEMFGFDYDWSREVNTTDPAYYKWTQWIFLKLLEKGLAFQSHEPIDWCPSCKTGLAKEDIEDGKCERCGTVVEKKPLRQWVLRITDYAERLLADLDAKEGGIPLMVRREGPDAVRPNMPFQERNAVVAIIKHWKKDEFLCLDWKKVSWHGFVVGGVEDGEKIEDASIREIKEETGYQNMRFVKTLGRLDSQFYQSVKQVNRFAHFTAVYVELIDGEQKDIAAEEKALHELNWVSRKKVASHIDRPDLQYMWQLFTGEVVQNETTLKTRPMLDWPESIRELQKNWIGKSEGAEVIFPIVGASGNLKDAVDSIKVFTTRIDTIFSGTFLILAPEHSLLQTLKSRISNWAEIEAYQEKTKTIPEMDRTAEGRDWTGVQLKGIQVTNPATGEKIPVWIADFVLAHYGTGAVFADAHDARDFILAKKYGIPLKTSLKPKAPDVNNLHAKIKNLETCFSEEGILINSGQFDGMTSAEARPKIIKWLSEKQAAIPKTNYRLRDWVFSRQRYWGEPIPVIHCEKCGAVPVPEKELPVILPKVDSYEPTGTGESPLAAIEKWVNTKCPKCRGKAKRETNTMPQWAGSCWYYLRYMDSQNKKALVDPRKEKYWAPVDLYVGGAEHATRHLIYARFWHKFLHDIGVVSTIEPFKKLQHVGLIMAEDGRKMSKRWGNVVNPDDVVKLYGADTLRLYEMFMGPFDQAIAWSTNSMIGSRRFIERVWKMREKVGKSESSVKLDAVLHKTIQKVGEDISAMKFNTAISSLMILLNAAEDAGGMTHEQYEIFLKLLAPFAPHVSEELWSTMGNKKSIHTSAWPVADQSKMKEESIEIPVQVNGKVRGQLIVGGEKTDAELEQMALALPEVKKWTEGKNIKKVIVVKGRLVSVVAV